MFVKKKNRYRAYFTYNKHRYNLGNYDTVEGAAKAYDKAVLYYCKEFARTNFPKEQYTKEDLEWARDYIETDKYKNAKRSSKYKGVCKHKLGWQAYTTYESKSIHIGIFKVEEDAARAYDKKMLELWGDSAKLNFPKENYIKGAIE